MSNQLTLSQFVKDFIASIGPHDDPQIHAWCHALVGEAADGRGASVARLMARIRGRLATALAAPQK
jgi:hypothetical protein